MCALVSLVPLLKSTMVKKYHGEKVTLLKSTIIKN
jgi:hypothetical protein